MAEGRNGVKVLIVKTSSLGDIIHCFPVLDYLHSRHSDVIVDWVVEERFAELVRSHPYVEKVVEVNTQRWRRCLLSWSTWRQIGQFRRSLREETYDVVFDLQGNIKSGIITGMSKAREKVGLGKNSVSERLNMLFTEKRFEPPLHTNIRDGYLSIVQQYFSDAHAFDKPSGVLLSLTTHERKLLKAITLPKGLPLVMVCPGSAWPNKRLKKEALADFLSLLQKKKHCAFLVVWGSKEERRVGEWLVEQLEDTSLLQRLPVPVLQHVMDRADLVIAMDSLPLHLAGTTRTPTFSIFGASSMQKYKPCGSLHHGIQGTCPYGITFIKRCPRLRTCSTGACVRTLTGQQVMDAFDKQAKQLDVTE